MKKLLILLTLGLMFGQTEWTTRVYDINLNIYATESMNINLYEITGLDISNALIDIISVDDNILLGDMRELRYECLSTSYDNVILVNDNRIFASNSMKYFSNNQCHFFSQNGDFFGNIKLAITAEFPIEDTGYMEEDFDFCINEGLNLVSYPCENDIAINDALPSEISNNLSSIVGEGVAGVNVNGTWVGSLTQLQAGSGYWFKSSIEACFNYECAEN